MQRMMLSCGSVPAEYFMSKARGAEVFYRRCDPTRDGFWRAEMQRAAIDFLVEGSPMVGGQPRSAPMRSRETL